MNDKAPDGAFEAGTAVEFYAGHKGGETPRAVVAAGRRFEVRRVLDRRRVLDAASGSTREVWRCLLDDGRTVTVELLEDGSRRVLFPG